MRVVKSRSLVYFWSSVYTYLQERCNDESICPLCNCDESCVYCEIPAVLRASKCAYTHNMMLALLVDCQE